MTKHLAAAALAGVPSQSFFHDTVRLEFAANTFQGVDGLGLCLLFSWPSDGMQLGCLPDRMNARETAPDLSTLLNAFYDWLLGPPRLNLDPER